MMTCYGTRCLISTSIKAMEGMKQATAAYLLCLEQGWEAILILENNSIL